jgi:hypothetical protein
MNREDIVMKGKAFRRALETNESYRIMEDVPLIVDTTECIGPEEAKKYLDKNKDNRPVNWRKVEEFKKSMLSGDWVLHSQGIIVDESGNLLTGQKRLLAIVLSGTSQYMRVSRGCPANTAPLIDRGVSQSNRDLASRNTGRKHSPTEASVARAMIAIRGNTKPSVDEIACVISGSDELLAKMMEMTRGTKKTKERMMAMAAICHCSEDLDQASKLFGYIEEMGDQIVLDLHPIEVKRCWNKGAAFILAMEKAVNIVNGKVLEIPKHRGAA